VERITREVSAEQVERDQLTTELKGAELSVGKVRAAFAEVRRERAERAARRAGLAAEKHQREGEVREKRAALAGQLRAAYTIGRQEPLKLLLNQKDRALAGRLLGYFGYFGRARGAQLRRVRVGCAGTACWWRPSVERRSRRSARGASSTPTGCRGSGSSPSSTTGTGI